MECEQREARGMTVKTEVKRYIWPNGRRRATVYKAFYIYRISVVARFFYCDDKRSPPTTDLLGERRGVFPDSTTGARFPFAFVIADRGEGISQGKEGCFGEILIGQFVGVARVKDVCVIESTRGRINRLALIMKRRRYTNATRRFVRLENHISR